MGRKEDLVARAKKPAEDALKLHPFYRGKIETVPKCEIRDFQDFAVWYSPGVAAPCKEIAQNRELVYSYTNKWNTVAVVSDGTRVLGLGDIGPEAGLPVMEGKALLFKYLGGVDAFPICLGTKDPDEIISAVKWIQPSFGGVNLEDIEQPKCFYVLERLREEAEIPVWHDDQQGTAAVTVAGLVNALKLVGKDISKVDIAMIGAGAANIRTAWLIIAAGADPGRIVMCDTKGTLHKGRTELARTHKEKWELAQRTNERCVEGQIPDAMRGADVVIALSKPGPDVIHPEWVKSMAKDPIVFVCANPVPEMWPWDATEAGAAVVATGRSDFPNQVNNSLGFPAIFRGTLDVRAKTITDEMCLAAALELARCAEDRGLSREYIIPTMDEWEVYPREAAAVGTKAIEQGVARITLTWDELYKNAEAMISRSRETARLLMEKGIIPKAARG
ncbi:MAG: NADP-dependent malic enzyme [Firmicutes bacterium]|jgi:malate dehydrogenase (oxaloacetate-decarboxylating)|nr:NADP-dependent malic enzyme [Bacillota bacterium]MDH7494489.1 NADP-dependent malic enzyme [Bacillota bacterium]